jgi:hypothetical protein
VGVVSVQWEPCEHVHLAPARLLHRLADRRLEPVAQIEDDRRVDDPADLARSELQIVRLRAGRRQVLDVEAWPADSLGGVGEGIEGRNDRVLPA